jgi:hypothetical protein
MQKFKLSWMALLRNDEHAQLIEQLCGILDDRPVENPYVTKAAAKVKLHLPALRCVGSESRKHELTGVLEELSEKRRRTLISLDMRVKAALWSPLTEESEPAEVLRFWLDKQGKRLVKGSRIAQTRRVNEMLRDVADDASLRKALEALHLMPLVENLRETNDAFGATFLKRNDDWARKEKSNRRVIRKSVDEAVKLLMGMLASFAELDGQSGYAELIGELDRLLVYYRRTVAVRKGRRSAAKERAKSREHRSNADMQSGREELDIQGMQDGRDERGNLNERSKTGVGNERNNWGIQSKWNNSGVGEDERGERNERGKWGNWDTQSTWSKADVQNNERGELSEWNERSERDKFEKLQKQERGVILRMQKESDKQGSREEKGIQIKQSSREKHNMQDGRNEQDTQRPLPDVAEEQRREQSACRERTSSSLAVAKVQRRERGEGRESREHKEHEDGRGQGEIREHREHREHREGREYKERSKSGEGIETSSFPDKANIS